MNEKELRDAVERMPRSIEPPEDLWPGIRERIRRGKGVEGWGTRRWPVWVALASAPDWRWLLDRDDSPWYPTMRLFRQRKAGDWAAVMAEIAAQLRHRLVVASPFVGAE